MSILYVLILVADAWAILQLVQGKGSNEKKALWVLLILVMPFLGVVLWYLLGRKD